MMPLSLQAASFAVLYIERADVKCFCMVCLFVHCVGGYLLKRMDNSEILKLIFC